MNGAKQRARKKELSFNIDLDDIIIPEYCPVLDIKLIRHVGERSGFFDDSPSLDRINPSLGYVKGNVRVISARANLLKNNATIDELQKVLDDLIKCCG